MAPLFLVWGLVPVMAGEQWQAGRRAALGLAVAAALLGGCGGGEPGSTASGPECAHRIGYVTGAGTVNDEASNQAGWEGVLAGAAALGLSDECASFAEASAGAAYGPLIESFVSEGFDIVVTNGFTMGEATREAGRQHPEVSFIGIDQRQTDTLPNVAGLVYHEEQEGFLAGALAGLLTESGVVGGVFGCETVPPVIRYAVGFRNGAQHVRPDGVVLPAFHIGSLDVCFFDPAYGAQLAEGLLEEGADIVFGAGGQTGDGALVAACEAGAKVVGSGTDRYDGLPEARDCLVTSVTRDLASSVSDLIVSIGDGTFTGGEVYGEVGLAPYHEFESLVPEEVKAQLDELGEQLARGEIDACAPPNEGAFCAPVR